VPRVRCPQCGSEFEREQTQFCPNPKCGYPVAFIEEPPPTVAEEAMVRRPGERVASAPREGAVLDLPLPDPPRVRPLPSDEGGTAPPIHYYGPSGELVGILLISRDATARREAEEGREAAAVELWHALEEAERLNSLLQEDQSR